MWIKSLSGMLINLNMCSYIYYNKVTDETVVKITTPKLYSDIFSVAKGNKVDEIGEKMSSFNKLLDFTKED